MPVTIRASSGKCCAGGPERGSVITSPIWDAGNFRRLVEDDEPVVPYPETRDLGYMLYDMDFSDRQHIIPEFFHARLEKGVMDLRNCEVHR